MLEAHVQGPELIFGLVGPLGTDLSAVARALQDALDQVGYKSQVYRLSRLMWDLASPPWSELSDGPRDVEIDAHMTAGNKLREILDRNDAVAMLGLVAILKFREEKTGDPTLPIGQFAHILQSLKRPEEVETLRRIYGPALVVLAAYAPRSQRLQDLARRIAESRFSNQIGDFLTTSEQLLRRDEAEIGDDYGQNVEETFPIADMVIDTSDRSAMTASIQRAIELLFGNVFATPSPDEQGMYFAGAAAWRSGSPARQVGAALCRPDGTLAGIGMNEVPKSGGGAYWLGDDADGRDFRWDRDSSDQMRENLLADILQRLKDANWLNEAKLKEPVGTLVDVALRGGRRPIMKGAQFLSTIDYIRAVHAEMAAITDAARHGVATNQCTLYTTTFPCHDCAKHIVAAGIRKVVYIEPYRKSLVQELYADSIAVEQADSCGEKVAFVPFVGVAPRRYFEFFAVSNRKRKNKDGSLVHWQRTNGRPYVPGYMSTAGARVAAEQEELKLFLERLNQKGLAEPKEDA
jgi:cytidine deaminase